MTNGYVFSQERGRKGDGKFAILATFTGKEKKHLMLESYGYETETSARESMKKRVEDETAMLNAARVLMQSSLNKYTEDGAFEGESQVEFSERERRVQDAIKDMRLPDYAVYELRRIDGTPVATLPRLEGLSVRDLT